MKPDPSDNMVRTGFAKRLETIRIGMACSAEQFAAGLGIPHDQYTEYEKGQAEVPIYLLARIAETAAVSVRYLLTGEVFSRDSTSNSSGPSAEDNNADEDMVWWWMTDENHRLIGNWHPDKKSRPTPSAHRAPPRAIGKTRWERAGVDPSKDSHWGQHRADLEARRPFADFCYILVSKHCHPRKFTVSGRPVYTPEGAFKGYSGFCHVEAVSELAAKQA